MDSAPEAPSLVGSQQAAAEARIGYTPATQALVEELTRRHFPRGR
jgi:hypothetical protein